MVHEVSCPDVGCVGIDAYPEGSLCADMTRPILPENGFQVELGSRKGMNGTSPAG